MIYRSLITYVCNFFVKLDGKGNELLVLSKKPRKIPGLSQYLASYPLPL
jgi:hypothetical protein